MKFITPFGKSKNVNLSKYLIDWNDDSLSKFQWKTKQFLYPYWRTHVVCEELLLAGTRLRLDFLNVSRNIAIECQGAQHTNFNSHFHNGKRSNYLGQIKRDLNKSEWCEKNDLLLVEIFEQDIDDLSPQWFLEKYDITL